MNLVSLLIILMIMAAVAVIVFADDIFTEKKPNEHNCDDYNNCQGCPYKTKMYDKSRPSWMTMEQWKKAMNDIGAKTEYYYCNYYENNLENIKKYGRH